MKLKHQATDLFSTGSLFGPSDNKIHQATDLFSTGSLFGPSDNKISKSKFTFHGVNTNNNTDPPKIKQRVSTDHSSSNQQKKSLLVPI
jgi:hypothetical protein